MSVTVPTASKSARIGIMGAGLAGLGLAVRLRRDGRDDFLVLERADAVGGTWRDNQYPGCTCDVPSNLYQYSFAPNPDWSSAFAPQGEIRAYIERVATDYDLHRSVRFGTDVVAASFDDAAQQWTVETSRGTYSFDVLVNATGPLSAPFVPDFPGLDTFKGPVFHSAEWDPSVDLSGKRVAVVGTGASAIQIVPELQKITSELKLFQRTAPYVMPRTDFDTSALRRRVFRKVPMLQRAFYRGLYWAHETLVFGLTRNRAGMAMPKFLAARHLRQQIPANPELRAKVTPDYEIGCKRMLMSNTYLASLDEPNVEVLTTGVQSVGARSVTGASGEERQVDAIILATGFRVNDLPIAHRLRGTNGTTLAEAWQGSMQAYRGATIPGFPNFFFVIGPNTGVGHSSMIYMAEAAANYVADAVRQMDEHDIGSVDVRPERAERWNAGVQRRMQKTVWLTGGCGSWYLDATGRNTTLWPDYTYRFRKLTKRFDVASYTTVPRRSAEGPSLAAEQPAAVA